MAAHTCYTMFDVVTDNSAQKEFVRFAAAAAVAREKPKGLTAAIARSIYVYVHKRKSPRLIYRHDRAL